VSSQIQGFTSANVLEIEANTRAARVTLRPEDFGALGAYSIGNSNGTTQMSAALGTGAPIFSARWGNASNLALIKRLRLSVGAGATAFTAGAAQFHLIAARGFTASDTGGTSILPSGNGNKLRTSMGTTLFSDIRISATGTLSAGTRTLDPQPLASVVAGVVATAGTPILAPHALLDQRPGEYPLVLAQNEGFVIQATVPATGTWFFSVDMEWLEVASY
jgi:hypothetical protein